MAITMAHAADIAYPPLKAALGPWIAMDPLGNVPILLALTRGQTRAQRRRVLLLTWLVALGILIAAPGVLYVRSGILELMP